MKTVVMRLSALIATLLLAITVCVGQEPAPGPAKIEVSYDAAEDRSTVRLLPVQISGENGKYRSLHMSPFVRVPGRTPTLPAIVDFELQTVVKGRLRTDLYVLFIIDGEKLFLSSSRWAVKRPVPGRVWMGERLVFRMPSEIFQQICRAKKLEIRFDAVTFMVGEAQKAALRELLSRLQPKQ